jgi:PilZ domain
MRTVTVPSLVSGQHVVVRNVHVGTLPATVERSDASSVTVALTAKDDRITRLVGHELAVEVISGRGIHRYGGVLSAQNAGSLTITLSGDVERIQRREYVRIAAHLEVTVKGIDEPIGGETSTLDVSGSGIRITDKWRLPLGLDVRVELKLPEGPPLSALGRVVRGGAEEDQKGIRLDGVGRGDEDRLMRYIRDREVQALRASRGR